MFQIIALGEQIATAPCFNNSGSSTYSHLIRKIENKKKGFKGLTTKYSRYENENWLCSTRKVMCHYSLQPLLLFFIDFIILSFFKHIYKWHFSH